MPKDNLSGEQLDQVNLTGSDLSDTDLSKASLRHSQLKRARLRNANLADSDLRGAHLEGADLTGANLRNADLSDADLRGVDLRRAGTVEGIKLAGAIGVPEDMVEQAATDQVVSVRWDTDTRGRNAGDSHWITPDVQRLLESLSKPAWIAESPEVHLQPHLQNACEADDTPWRLRAVESSDRAFVVTVFWDRPQGEPRDLRADAFALIGSIAKATTFVQQRRTDDAIEYRIATGMTAGDGPDAPHGHVIVLRVVGPAVERWGPLAG